METTRNEILSKNLSDFILDKKDLETIENSNLWKKKDIFEVKFDINGKYKILEITITPVYLKDKSIVFGVGNDITERKKGENEILRSLKRKRTSFKGNTSQGKK